MRSIRWRLIANTSAGVTIVLGLGAALAFIRIRESLYAELDRGLHQRAVSLLPFIAEKKGEIELEWLEFGLEPPGFQKGVDYFCLRRKDGTTVASSSEWARATVPQLSDSTSEPVFRAISLPGGASGRAVAIDMQPEVNLSKAEKAARLARGETRSPEGSHLQLVVARVDPVAPTVAAIRRLLVAVWVGCSLWSGAVIIYVVRRSLRSLDELKGRIGDLRDTISGQRITLRAPPVELAPVTLELNRLLERVESALVRERNLTSNVAHELRTPLAGILSTLEVTLSRPRSVDEYRESAHECMEIAKRLHWLVSNLLSLTRLEAGQVQLRPVPVDLAAVFAEWWQPFTARANERGLRIAWAITPAATLRTDSEFLRVVMNNLFDNAVSYTRAGGAIRIEAGARGEISVANQALETSPALIAHAFDPFWRHSRSREEVGTHAGIGLSLCRKIVEVLGGRISARIQEPQSWFVVQVDFPRSDFA